MTARHQDYFLGETNEETSRLYRMAQALTADAEQLLERAGIGAGWRVVDVGCGPLGALDVLSARVGPGGRVVGLERAEAFVAAARAAVAARALDNVEIVQADVHRNTLPPESMDAAHERLVLIQAGDPPGVLDAMVRLVRPGGVVLAEEFDCGGWACHPAHPAWDTLLELFLEVATAGGANVEFGRTLPGMLRAAGLTEVQAVARVHTPAPGDYLRYHLLSLLDSVRETVLAQGRLTAPQWTELTTRLRAHLDDPATFLLGQPLVQAWGYKPLARP
ncbi:methyltransferase domain-containing protein [Nocardia transvalensis]|uniref:methyltransferase domain-containing protein n=1 Tax=Nocardia transvalensis TaxID=37333 RepID=UPI00189550AA|nr:methyltransferase domain-containing protein [Nocardia transvalensis]MBF6332274.1 methyltransferase domain-containing protein [Nocardia transvalensis]